MKEKTEYNVLSPDGIHIEMNKTYPTMKAVNLAFKNFVNRYKMQGYYSSATHGRIPVEMIKAFCKLQIIKNNVVISIIDFE